MPLPTEAAAWLLQAGAVAVAPDRTGTGVWGGLGLSTPTAPAKLTPMNSDHQTILRSALNASGAQDSDSAFQSSATPASEVLCQAAQHPAASDYVMVEAATASDERAALDDSGVTGPSGADESGVTKPGEQDVGGAERDIAQMGFAVCGPKTQKWGRANADAPAGSASALPAQDTGATHLPPCRTIFDSKLTYF